MSFAKNLHWTPEQVNTLTLRQVIVLGMDDKELDNHGRMPSTKNGRKKIQPKIDAAIRNLIEGRRWNSPRE